MSLEERNDFFVQRCRTITSKTRQTIHVIFAHIKDNDIDTRKRDLMPSKDFRTTSNISRIRIPAALFISDEVSDTSVYSSLIENYRKQVGAHLLVNSKGCLCYVYTNLDQDQNYVSSSLHYINEVYPCYISADSDSKFCFGLRFTNNLNEGFRSFSRTIDNLSPSGGVFDLTENIIHPNRLKTGIKSQINRVMFPKGQDYYAIYICDGAKLIVEDDRFFELTDNDSNNRGKYLNSSLFQSGSMVIFAAQLVIQTSYKLINNENIHGLEAIEHLSFDEAIKKNLIEPEDGLFKHWFKTRRLHLKKERVIFLGHNYSVHNSICWRLRINYLLPENNHNSAVLSAPEGGRIVDIQDWDWGMTEVYWRQCFERIYEKVLNQAVTNVYNQHHFFNYYIPSTSGKNTFYWQRKIVGVGKNFNSWKINLSYKYKDQISTMIPPYYEQYTDLVEIVKPFAPPLHPPIYFKRQFYYLPYKTYPIYLTNQLVDIRGQLFRIKFKEGVEEYEWSEPKRVSEYQNKNFSIDERIGIDLMVYQRIDSVIGTKILFYFEIYSTQNLNQKQSDEMTGQWIQRQNEEFGDSYEIQKKPKKQKPIEKRRHKRKKRRKD